MDEGPQEGVAEMIAPAIIEPQSLPGFVTSEGCEVPRQGLREQQYNNVSRAMKAYHLEDSIILQTVTQLLRLVGVTHSMTR
jgi:myosin V